jgi:hypothetical protein
MFNLEQQIKAWRGELSRAGINSPEVLAELESHLREQTARLVGSGLSEEEAFQNALRQLGNSRALEQEFSKVGRHRIWGYRNNPLALKILALSLIITGIDPLITGIRVFAEGVMGGDKLIINPAVGLMIVINCFRIFIGIKLLRRSNAWRIVALIWSGIALMVIPMLFAWKFFFHQAFLANQVPTPDTDFFMGLTVPFEFTLGVYFLHLTILAWGLHTLMKRSVRNLFRPTLA